jgi:hypothetical protein
MKKKFKKFKKLSFYFQLSMYIILFVYCTHNMYYIMQHKGRHNPAYVPRQIKFLKKISSDIKKTIKKNRLKKNINLEDPLNNTKMQIFELKISDENLEKMKKTKLEGETVYGKNVPAEFICNNKKYNVKIKYKGSMSQHWKYPQKSFRVIFDSNDLFYGIKQLNLDACKITIPFSFIMEYQLGRLLGLLSPVSFMAHLRLNGKFYGITRVYERVDKYFLKRRNLKLRDIYADKVEGDDIFNKINMWKKTSWDKSGKDDYESLENLLSVFEKARSGENIKDFLALIDLDRIAVWYAHMILVNTTHSDNHNFRLYLNEKDKFELIPNDLQGWSYPKNLRKNIADYFFNDIIDFLVENCPEFGYKKNLALWSVLKDNFIIFYEMDMIEQCDRLIRYDFSRQKSRNSIALSAIQKPPIGWGFEGVKYIEVEDFDMDFYKDQLTKLKEFVFKYNRALIAELKSIECHFSQFFISSNIKKNQNYLYLEVINNSKVTVQLDEIKVSNLNKIYSDIFIIYEDSNYNSKVDFEDKKIKYKFLLNKDNTISFLLEDYMIFPKRVNFSVRPNEEVAFEPVLKRFIICINEKIVNELKIEQVIFKNKVTEDTYLKSDIRCKDVIFEMEKLYLR